MTNSDDVAAAEIVIPLGEQLTLIEGSVGVVSSRIGNHSMSHGYTDNQLRVLIYNTRIAPLPHDEGRLLTFRVCLGNEPLRFTLKPEVLLSDVDGNALPVTVAEGHVTILAPRLEISESVIDFGRIAIRSAYTHSITLRNTGTAMLHVACMNATDETVELSAKSFDIEAGGHRQVVITYSPVVRGVFEGKICIESDDEAGFHTIALKAAPYSVNQIAVSSATGCSGSDVILTISMDNMETVVAMQLRIPLSASMQYVDGSMAVTGRAVGMKAFCSQSGGMLNIYLYGDEGQTIAEGSGAVLSFSLHLDGRSGQYMLTPTDVVLGVESLDNLVSGIEGGLLRIESACLECDDLWIMDDMPVEVSTTQTFRLHNSGQDTLRVATAEFSDTCFVLQTALPLNIAPGTDAELTASCTPSVGGSRSSILNIYTNDPEHRMKTIMVEGMVFEPNTISISGVVDVDNRTCTVSIGMDNYSDIVAVQMNLHVDVGMTVLNDAVVIGDRCNAHDVTVVGNDGGNYRLLLYSLTNTPIDGHDGTLCVFTFSLDEGELADNIRVVADSIVLSDASGRNMASAVKVECMVQVYPESRFAVEDVNHDGVVDSQDVLRIYEWMRQSDGDDAGLQEDVNGDGIVDSQDVLCIYEKMREE